MSDEKDLLIKYSNSMSIPLKDEKIDTLLSFMHLVLEKNKVLNLTSITNSNDFIQKHLIDSLTGLKFIKDGSKVLDIGVGGGFPSVPLACVKQNCEFVSVDSVGKKINFLKEAIKKLKISNVSPIYDRVENLIDLYEPFDIVISRAVGHLGILLELAIPFLTVGGLFVAYKANDSEIAVLKNEMKLLGCEIDTIDSFSLPNGDNRCLIIFKKVSKTSQIYPRNFSAIKKNPLYEV